MLQLPPLSQAARRSNWAVEPPAEAEEATAVWPTASAAVIPPATRKGAATERLA